VQDAGGPGGGPVLREALIPHGEFEILDTWQVAGLRGSGSHDVAVRDRFVPEAHMTAAMATPAQVASPLFRLPPLNRLAYNKVGVATGIARAALDAFAALASETKRRASSQALRDKPAVQRAVAEAELLLRSARAFVFEAGRPTEPRERALVHLACSGAVRASVEAVALVHEAVGTRANFTGHPLERRLRDVRVVPQHITVSSQWLEASGGVLLGLPKELPFG
jgi:alkylation response protein AidB-like acyl-CoA dehydrogenase